MLTRTARSRSASRSIRRYPHPPLAAMISRARSSHALGGDTLDRTWLSQSEPGTCSRCRCRNGTGPVNAATHSFAALYTAGGTAPLPRLSPTTAEGPPHPAAAALCVRRGPIHRRCTWAPGPASQRQRDWQAHVRRAGLRVVDPPRTTIGTDRGDHHLIRSMSRRAHARSPRALVDQGGWLIVMSPMSHGWASACSTVTSASSARLFQRNGPPLAVSPKATSPAGLARVPQQRRLSRPARAPGFAAARTKDHWRPGSCWPGRRCVLRARREVNAAPGTRPPVEHHVRRPRASSVIASGGEDLRDLEIAGGVPAAPRRSD